MNLPKRTSSTVNRIAFILLVTIIFTCNKTEEKIDEADLLPYYQEATFTPNWFQTVEDVPEDFHQIPDFTLSNQSGEIVSEATLKDKIYVVDFFFTSCPGICPKMTTNMLLVQEAFLENDDVVILSHSVTPEMDSTAVLQKYADIKGIVEGKWHLLTGDRDIIYDLGRHQYFVEEDLGLEKQPEDFIHTENFILVDTNRHIRGIYNGLNKTSVRQLIEDIKSLQKAEES